MLNDEFDLDSILDLRPSEVAEFCDRHLDAQELSERVEGWSPFGRKGLCEYLGIGESTLSGWLKEGRVPQMAKNAFVLLLAHQRLSAQVRELQAQLDNARAKDLKVVRTGQHFQVCEFQEDEEGEVVGRIVADQISTLEDARLLAAGHRMLRLARETAPIFQYVYEKFPNAEFVDQVEKIERKLEEQELFVTNYETWKVRFGKGERSFKDFFGEAEQEPEQALDPSADGRKEASDD